MELRVPGVCAICRRPVIFDGKRWVDKPRRVHTCPVARPACGALMPGSGRAPERRLRAGVGLERCGRAPDHNGGHRSRWAMDNELYAKTGRRLASAATKAHSRSVGVSDAPSHESARLPLTPVEPSRLNLSVE